MFYVLRWTSTWSRGRSQTQDRVWFSGESEEVLVVCNDFRIFAFHGEKEGHVFPNPHYHRVEEGQEPVNLTGGPLAYKYQFQEMFFHWGEKVNMIEIMVEMVELGSMIFQF